MMQLDGHPTVVHDVEHLRRSILVLTSKAP
jgi:hypothetical protein